MERVEYSEQTTMTAANNKAGMPSADDQIFVLLYEGCSYREIRQIIGNNLSLAHISYLRERLDIYRTWLGEDLDQIVRQPSSVTLGRRMLKKVLWYICTMNIPTDEKKKIIDTVLRICADAKEKKDLEEFCEDVLFPNGEQLFSIRG